MQGVSGRQVHKGQDHVAIKQQSFAFARVGHIAELMGRNVELFGEDLPVACSLVEHEDEVGVLKNIRHLVRSQQVLDVLGNAGGRAAPLAEALPDLHRVGRGLFLTK